MLCFCLKPYQKIVFAVKIISPKDPVEHSYIYNNATPYVFMYVKKNIYYLFLIFPFAMDTEMEIPQKERINSELEMRKKIKKKRM